MTKTDLYFLVAGVAMLFVVFCVVRWSYWRDFQRGRKAHRDGLRYNYRWSPGTREGWLKEDSQ